MLPIRSALGLVAALLVQSYVEAHLIPFEENGSHERSVAVATLSIPTTLEDKTTPSDPVTISSMILENTTTGSDSLIIDTSMTSDADSKPVGTDIPVSEPPSGVDKKDNCPMLESKLEKLHTLLDLTLDSEPHAVRKIFVVPRPLAAPAHFAAPKLYAALGPFTAPGPYAAFGSFAAPGPFTASEPFAAPGPFIVPGSFAAPGPLSAPEPFSAPELIVIKPQPDCKSLENILLRLVDIEKNVQELTSVLSTIKKQVLSHTATTAVPPADSSDFSASQGPTLLDSMVPREVPGSVTVLVDPPRSSEHTYQNEGSIPNSF